MDLAPELVAVIQGSKVIQGKNNVFLSFIKEGKQLTQKYLYFLNRLVFVHLSMQNMQHFPYQHLQTRLPVYHTDEFPRVSSPV